MSPNNQRPDGQANGGLKCIIIAEMRERLLPASVLAPWRTCPDTPPLPGTSRKVAGGWEGGCCVKSCSPHRRQQQPLRGGQSPGHDSRSQTGWTWAQSQVKDSGPHQAAMFALPWWQVHYLPGGCQAHSTTSAATTSAATTEQAANPGSGPRGGGWGVTGTHPSGQQLSYQNMETQEKHPEVRAKDGVGV